MFEIKPTAFITENNASVNVFLKVNVVVSLLSGGQGGFAPSLRYLKESENVQPRTGRVALLNRLQNYYEKMAVDTTQGINALDNFKNPFIQAKAFTLDNAAKIEGLIESDSTDFINQENNDLAAKLTKIAVDYGYGGVFNAPSFIPQGPFGTYDDFDTQPIPKIIGFGGWGFIEDLNNIDVDDLVTPIGDFILGGEYGSLLGDFGGMGGLGAGLGALASMGGITGGAGGFGGVAGFGGLENSMNYRQNILSQQDEAQQGLNNTNANISYDFSEFADIGLNQILAAWGSGLRAPSFDQMANRAVQNLLFQNLAQLPPTGNSFSAGVQNGTGEYNSREPITQVGAIEAFLAPSSPEYYVRKIGMADLLKALNIETLPAFYNPFNALVARNSDLFTGGGGAGRLPPMGGGGGRLGGIGNNSSRSAVGKAVAPALGIDFYDFLKEFDFSGLVSLYDFLKGIIEEFNLHLQSLDLSPYQDFLNKIRQLLYENSGDSPGYGRTPPSGYSYNNAIASSDQEEVVNFLESVEGITDDGVKTAVEEMLQGFISKKRIEKQINPSSSSSDFVLPPQFLNKLGTTAIVIDGVMNVSLFIKAIALNKRTGIIRKATINNKLIYVSRIIYDPILFKNVLAFTTLIYINVIRRIDLAPEGILFKRSVFVDVVLSPSRLNILNCSSSTFPLMIVQIVNIKTIRLSAEQRETLIYIDTVEIQRIWNVPVRNVFIKGILIVRPNKVFLQRSSKTANINVIQIDIIVLPQFKSIYAPLSRSFKLGLFENFVIKLLSPKTIALNNLQIRTVWIIAEIASKTLYFIDVLLFNTLIIPNTVQHTPPDRSMVNVLYPSEINTGLFILFITGIIENENASDYEYGVSITLEPGTDLLI